MYLTTKGCHLTCLVKWLPLTLPYLYLTLPSLTLPYLYLTLPYLRGELFAQHYTEASMMGPMRIGNVVVRTSASDCLEGWRKYRGHACLRESPECQPPRGATGLHMQTNDTRDRFEPV